MADGKYVKVYLNGVRVANVPNANIGRGKVVVVGVPGSDDEPGYLSNIRIAAGGKPLYDAIMADGRVATHGILFDTGSDRIRGESKPTLDMIGQMLNQHADLKLTIEGHTDNVGSAASNQTLSEKRAAAVRQFLISNYHVDAIAAGEQRPRRHEAGRAERHAGRPPAEPARRARQELINAQQRSKHS